jgi:signal transduction histidine kinase
VSLFSLLAFCILAISLTFFALSAEKPYMGMTLYMSDQGWAVESVDPYGLAIQAGIKVGDRPTEINGQPAETSLEKYEKLGLVTSILIKELTVIDEHGQLKSVTLKDSSPSLQSLAALKAYFVTCLIFWLIGFYVFFKRPRNMASLLLGFCGLCFGLILSSNYAAERLVPTASWFAVIAAVIGPWLLLHFFLILPDERYWLRSNPMIYLIYLPAAITIAFFPLIGYADGQPLPGFRNFRLIECGVGFLATASVAIFNYFCAASVKTRQQMKIVLISCLAALFPFLVLYLIPQTLWRQSFIPTGYSILFVVFIPMGMGFAVVTKKLMDIDILIRRGVVYGLITIVMTIILSIGIVAVVGSLNSFEVRREIFLALALGAVATALFGPAKNGAETLLDKFLYKDRYDYRHIIQSMSNSLKSIQDSTGISRIVVGTTVNTLNLAGGSLFVKVLSGSYEVSALQGIFTDITKQNQVLDLIHKRSPTIEFPNSASSICSDLSFLIPLTAGEREVGILCLSQKVSRQEFSSNDLYLLQEIAYVAAIALHSAMLIRDVSIRDTFVSVASHELRTPLTSIVGYTDLLLRRDPPDATRKRWLKNIFDNSQRVSNIVDDLLNVSRIQSGKFSIKLERVRLHDVLKETLSFTRESINKHKFVVEIEPDIPELLVDRDKFSEVVGNLLSNAVKYSPNGGCITLSAHSDKERHRVVVSVADEGIGISTADKDLLFTTFHRIQRPETQSIRGSGLGLYIAKEWTQAMGGRIWLESELNKGSTFFVEVPTQDSNEPADAASLIRVKHDK